MKFYPFDINDFRSATSHLTRMQRALYRELLDLYYDKELPFASGELEFERMAHKMACRSVDEKMDLELVLDEFFPVGCNGMRHNERADLEIGKYHAYIENGRKGGINSGMSRRARNEAKANHPSDIEPGLKGGSTTLEDPSNRGRTNKNENKKEKENKKEDGVPVGTPTSLPTSLVSQHGSAGETPANPEKVRKPSKKAPKDFEPSEEMVAKILTDLRVTPQHVKRETEKFKDHTFGRAITDWNGAWRNWQRNSIIFSKTGNRQALREEQNLDAADRFARGEG